MFLNFYKFFYILTFGYFLEWILFDITFFFVACREYTSTYLWHIHNSRTKSVTFDLRSAEPPPTLSTRFGFHWPALPNLGANLRRQINDRTAVSNRSVPERGFELSQSDCGSLLFCRVSIANVRREGSSKRRCRLVMDFARGRETCSLAPSDTRVTSPWLSTCATSRSDSMWTSRWTVPFTRVCRINSTTAALESCGMSPSAPLVWSWTSRYDFRVTLGLRTCRKFEFINLNKLRELSRWAKLNRKSKSEISRNSHLKEHLGPITPEAS